MPIVADFLDYDSAEIYNQKNTDSCTCFAFFTLLSEWCQQDRGMNLEFDIKKYFKRMNIERPSGKFRLNWLSKTARTEGFKAKTGEIVKITGYSTVIAFKSFRRLCETIQRHGPLIFSVNQYEGHRLNPATDVIAPVKKGATKKKQGHVMIIRGFDYPGRMIKFQNSWGNNSVKWIELPTYLQIVKGAWFFKGITIK